MELILLAATEAEIGPTLDYLKKKFPCRDKEFYLEENIKVKALICGVGPAASALAVGMLKPSPNTLIIHAGVSGAYDPGIPLGTLLEIGKERWGDLGAEDRDGSFIDIFQLGLQNPEIPPYLGGWIHNLASPATDLPLCAGITVSRTSGSASNIRSYSETYPEAVESMEGAGIFLACRTKGIPFVSIRAISNTVQPRDKSQWKMDLALENLNNYLINSILSPETFYRKLMSSN